MRRPEISGRLFFDGGQTQIIKQLILLRENASLTNRGE